MQEQTYVQNGISFFNVYIYGSSVLHASTVYGTWQTRTTYFVAAGSTASLWIGFYVDGNSGAFVVDFDK
jgi:hypothetical protein